MRVRDLFEHGLPLALLGAYVLVAPSFDLLPAINSYDEKRLGQLGIILITCIWLIASREARVALLDLLARMPLWVRLSLAAIGILGLTSALYATDPRIALLEVTHLALLFVLAAAVAGAFRRLGAAADMLMLSALCASAAIVVFDYYLLYVTSAATAATTSTSAILPQFAFPHFANVRFFGQWQTWTLPLLTGACLYLRGRGRARYWATLVICSLWWSLLVATATRGTLLGLAVAAMTIAALLGARAGRWLRVFATTAGAGLATYAAAYLAVPQGRAAFSGMFDHVASPSASGRAALWNEALELIRSHPLLGVGPQNYALQDMLTAHPHNSILQLACEWGVVAAAIALALAATGILAWAMTVRQALPAQPLSSDPSASGPGAVADPSVMISLTASLVAAATHSLVSGILVMPLSQTMLALVGGWAAGIAVRGTTTTMPSGRTQATAVVGLAAAAIAMVVCAVPPSGAAWFERHEIAGMKRERLQPRFWMRTRPPRVPLEVPPRR
ncbi:MAG: O-antigen ligase family protein [Myxococcales bacterium]|nr:MAG: O-antigen ligase family protein [Myxococcales bacterium]